MKYLVMECGLSYAIVLDEDGCFLKVPNLGYEVGQTVTDVILMESVVPAEKDKKMKKWMVSVTAAAACMVLLITSIFQLGQMPYASVYMAINPEVRIDVNRKDIVVALEGMNVDGDALTEGYQYKKKDLKLVMDELVEKAIDMGYLHEGGKISLVLDTEHNEWIVSHEDALTANLQKYLDEKMKVSIEVTDKNESQETVSIPVSPREPEQKDETEAKMPVQHTYGDSSYGDSGYGDSGYENSDYGDSGYGDSSYENSNHNDSEYEEDGMSDYESEEDDREDLFSDYDEEDDDEEDDDEEDDDEEEDTSDYDES